MGFNGLWQRPDYKMMVVNHMIQDCYENNLGEDNKTSFFLNSIMY